MTVPVQYYIKWRTIALLSDVWHTIQVFLDGKRPVEAEEGCTQVCAQTRLKLTVKDKAPLI